ncbi:MAG: glycoside hydrolase family 9 protein [Ignavibacteriales bacterium]|nr:glycoside hydrolase family 9 protein [Ignavibacteriales bacterium]
MLKNRSIQLWFVMLLGLAVVPLLLVERQGHAQTLVAVNQLGYRPQDPKVAFITEPLSGSFEVIDVTTNKSVLKANIRPIGLHDVSSGDVTFSLDFSRLSKKGRFQIWLPQISALSHEFEITGTAYNTAVTEALQSFYFQRCGAEVGMGTPWEHPACHLEPPTYFAERNRVKNVSGGWHDAGDYNKFVPTMAVSVAFLLYAYELRPTSFHDGQLAIPERSNGIPDILDEARWTLDWLLKMQDENGGVYHKVSIEKWTGEHLPHEEKDRQYIYGVSSASTGGFAAVTALAARIFERWDRPYAQTLLRASLRAWAFLEKNTVIVPPGGFKNPPGVEGGEYGDHQDDDERIWAAVELLRTTGSSKYHSYFLGKYKSLGGVHYPPSWQRTQNFAYFSYLRQPTASVDLSARGFIIGSIMRYCDNLLLRVDQSGYKFVLLPNEFYWGSNSVAMGYAADLLQAFEITGQRSYLNAALDQFHYMLGRNPFDKSFVTGVGIQPVKYPYHQFSMVATKGRPVPGLLVGGANQSGRLRGKILSEFPAKCYEDNEKNYFVNEVAINYTAPFVFVASYVAEPTPHVGAGVRMNPGIEE